jgi:curved DNA-binding protein CbpA
MTLYEVLGLTPPATAADIKAAHRQAVKAHHPDAGGDARKFEQVQRAYFTLSDPERRERYDSTGVEDDPAAATEEQLAQSTISSLIVQFIGGAEDLATTDILDPIRNALLQQKTLHNDACRQIERQLVRVGMLHDRLRRKDDGDDALPALLAERSRGLNGAKTKEQAQIRILERALRMLDDYTYRVDPTPYDEAKIWSALKS